MITDKQIKEIRKYLENAVNPLFFYDDDPDGLASFLLLKRKYQKGKGILIKAPPHDDSIYLRKIKENSPDLIVILDKPIISQSLIDQVKVPMLWIDHHEPLERFGIKYYNPMVLDKEDNRPTSYWCYKIVNQDLWIALTGIVGDWFAPKELLRKFRYKELIGDKKTPEEILFNEDLGILVKIFSFMIKGKTSDVRKYVSILEKIKNPYEILKKQTSKGKFIYKKFEKTNKEYESLLKTALKKVTKERLYVFIYPTGKDSFTGNLSNELLYKVDRDIIIVGREKDDEVRLSMRGKTVDILPMLKTALERVNGYGGGHKRACGANIKREDFPKFIEIMKNELKKIKKQS